MPLKEMPKGQACKYDNANLVQEVMDMPLEQYMDGFPSELEQLEDALPGQCAAYGQAALGISRISNHGGTGLSAPQSPRVKGDSFKRRQFVKSSPQSGGQTVG